MPIGRCGAVGVAMALLFLAGLSFAFLEERITCAKVTAIVISIMGIILIALPGTILTNNKTTDTLPGGMGQPTTLPVDYTAQNSDNLYVTTEAHLNPPQTQLTPHTIAGFIILSVGELFGAIQIILLVTVLKDLNLLALIFWTAVLGVLVSIAALFYVEELTFPTDINIILISSAML